MSKSIRDYTKTNRPPKTGTMVGVRMQDAELAQLDEYRRAQEDCPSRPEAIRRIIANALGERSDG